MGQCGCHLNEKLKCSNGIHEGKYWHRIRINISCERQKICRIVAMKISGKILCSGELGGLCGRHTIKTWTWLMKWNTYQGHEFENLSQYLFGGDLRSVLCLVTAAENVSVQFVFWSLGPLSKTCLRAPKTAATWHFPRPLWSLCVCTVVTK